jgi:hypothetical protein
MLALVLVYLGFFWCNALTGTILDVGEPDGMNFVDTARNIVTGRGIVQSTGGYSDPHFLSKADDLPSPLITQPPLYPVLLASLAWMRVPYVPAGLLISVVCYGLIALIGYRLISGLYGRPEALLAVALVVSLHPLRSWAGTLMSESLALLLALLILHLLATLRTARRPLPLAVLAGVVAGLAFATRYALLPLVGIAIVFLVLETRRRVAGVVLFLVGFGVPAGLVALRNVLLTGSLRLPRNPSTVGLVDNALAAWNVLVDVYLMAHYQRSWQLAAVVLVATAAVIALIRGRFRDRTCGWFLGQGRYILVAWGLAYVVFIVGLRTVIHFDPLNVRIMLPAGILVPLLLAPLLVRLTRARASVIGWVAIVVVLVTAAHEVRAFTLAPTPTWEAQIARRPALAWIARETTDEDLIIGSGAIGVPFFLGRSRAVSLSPYPYSDVVDGATLMAYVTKYAARYRHVYLVFARTYDDHAAWAAAYGEFIAGLITNRRDPPAGFALHRELPDAFVFEICKPGTPRCGRS